MLNKDQFFKDFSIDTNYFNSTGLIWDDLIKIYDDYSLLVPQLEKEAEYIVSKLIDLPSVHSVRRRVKKPKHLIEKIIRKGKKYVDKGISIETYKEIVTDLIGIRVLHLFKDDWKDIHHEILGLWEIKETPQININLIYLISIPVTKKNEILVEIQVRTVFEEAWSEIDHLMRYPYDIDNPIITEYLAIFNRIVGSADEMGTFIKNMKSHFSLNHNKNNNKRELDTKFK